ncbi:DUF2490 domain-containing protein [Seonamhaeicola sp. MEBiC1930]|uniref:DUF2490 domain-containing protein n=1 Tax=Seonamhaeicola sp. MEBiC01930 TaxID=2976768 RepID=UPI0032493258
MEKKGGLLLLRPINILSINTTLFLLVFSITTKSFTQNVFEALGESALSLNHQVSKDYAINFTFRSRYFLHKDALQYKQQQIDFFHFSTFKLNAIHKLSFGFYYRNRDWFDSGSDELRFMQEFVYSKQKAGVRYGHRFRLEERIFNNFTDFRPRYRFIMNLPINGKIWDVGGVFFVGSTEALLSLSEKHAPFFDHRFTTQFGWQVNQDLKLQGGLEYRLEGYNTSTKNYLFLLTTAIYKL